MTHFICPSKSTSLSLSELIHSIWPSVNRPNKYSDARGKDERSRGKVSNEWEKEDTYQSFSSYPDLIKKISINLEERGERDSIFTRVPVNEDAKKKKKVSLCV